MAILKGKIVSSGVSGNFWVMRNIQISPDYSFIRCSAQLFTSLGAFTSGNGAIFSEDVILTSNPVTSDAIETLLETYLVTSASGYADFLNGSVVSN